MAGASVSFSTGKQFPAAKKPKQSISFATGKQFAK
jgi:hypothetical protein